MCMLKLSSRLKASHDIVCYKVCICNADKIYSLHNNHFIWELNKEYEAERASPTRSKGNIFDGYFHSFDNIEYAKDLAAHSYWVKYAMVYKCIIPKGTYYYKGLHDDGRRGYASKKLKIVEEI